MLFVPFAAALAAGVAGARVGPNSGARTRSDIGLRSRLITGLLIVAMTAGSLVVGAAPARSATGAFVDDDASVHEADIDFIAALGITKGCNPPVNDRYCPADFVTRQQMAAFLGRTLKLVDGTGADLFVDDDGSIFEADIDRLGTEGVTKGCNPPANDHYCPLDLLTRAQMATFITRAVDLDPSETDRFVDDDGNIHEADINAVAEVGITKGCNPPANDRYCPSDFLTRAQMATFLRRMVEIIRPDLINISNRSVDEGKSLSFDIAVEEPEEVDDADDAISLTISGLPSFGALTDNGDGTGSIAFSPGFAAAGVYQMTVTATRRGYDDSDSFDLTVKNINRVPTLAKPADQISGEGSVVSLALSASDPDGDALEFTAVGLPAGLAIDAASGEISGTVGVASAAGSPYGVTVSVDDGTAAPVERTFTWSVTDTNRNPTLAALNDQQNMAGDAGVSLNLGPKASDPDGDGLTFSATGLPSGLAISAGGSITGGIAADAGGIHTVTIKVTDDGAPSLSAERAFTWLVTDPDAMLEVTRKGGHVATTRQTDALVLTNNSTDGTTIEKVVIDLRTAMYPDVVWDPEGTAGDSGFKCLTANALDATRVGFTAGSGVPPCVKPFFSGAHEGGWDVLTINFAHFEAGEKFRFSVESDPTSITIGGGAGKLNGMELTGAKVTVTFNSGAITTDLYKVLGELGGGRAIVRDALSFAAPTVSVPTHLGGLAATAWDASHPKDVKAGATTLANHTVRVTGPEGATVRLLVAESRLWLQDGDPGFQLDPFEANNMDHATEFQGVVTGGKAEFAVSLPTIGGLYYLAAVVRHLDGDVDTPDPTGRTSNIIILRRDA